MLESLDTCEAARYSCYIEPNMKMVPCSFDKSKKNEIQLRPTTIEEAWNSNKFNEFRKKLLNSCPNCKIRNLCMGGCPLMPEIVLCERKEKENENKNGFCNKF